jgi:hypothetical protein
MRAIWGSAGGNRGPSLLLGMTFFLFVVAKILDLWELCDSDPGFWRQNIDSSAVSRKILLHKDLVAWFWAGF